MVLVPPTRDLSNKYYLKLEKIGEKPKTDELKIVFTGSAYSANENAIIKFLDTATQIKNLKLLFATPKDWETIEKLKSVLKEIGVGFLDKEKCINLQNSPDVLFLPLRSILVTKRRSHMPSHVNSWSIWQLVSQLSS
ncbi:MAG: hypothetical protein NTV61_04900 [Candidatus Bathyarchaeota archaeon]|nr:hypothetical protein [Candidatus Bathyarchaeota archaeon]